MNRMAAEKVQVIPSAGESQSKDPDSAMKPRPTGEGASFAEKLGGLNRRVFAVILISASLVLVARLIAPFEVGKDQACQIESAQRLVNGQGLTGTDFDQTAPDITEPVRAGYVTWFPPGLSLIVASLLYVGLPLLIAQKILYGVVTMIGWVGWAVIAGRLLSIPIRLGKRSYPFHYVIAALIPIFTTPSWQGTDIFLWAGIPFFVLLLLKSASPRSAYWPVFAAGLLCGFLYSMRYASLFLGPAALLILAQVSLPDFKSLIKKGLVFLSSQLLVALPVVIYGKFFSERGSFIPQYIDPASHYSRIPRIISGILEGSSITSNLVFGFSFVHDVCVKLGSGLVKYAVGISCLIIIFSLPLIILKASGPDREARRKNLMLSFSFLPISLVVMLIGANIMAGQGLFHVKRYYLPILLCGVFIFYALASTRAANRVIRLASAAIALGFVTYLLVLMPATSLVPGRRGELIEQVLSFTPSKYTVATDAATSQEIGYPDYRMYSRKENSRRKLKELHEANPDAIFFVLGNYLYYVYDQFKGGGPTPGIDIKRFPKYSQYYKQAYTSRPAKVFWVLEHPTAVDEIKYLSFIPGSNLKTVFSDPSERTLILESDFSAGQRISQ